MVQIRSKVVKSKRHDSEVLPRTAPVNVRVPSAV
jgi:hypothetical protein